MKPVCLITGAGGRLGNALCNEMADEYDIIAVYRRTIPNCDSQLVRSIGYPKVPDKKNSGIYCVQADLTNIEDLRRLVEVSIAKFGQIDVVINSAADLKFHGKLIELFQADDYPESQLQLNAIVPFRLISMVYDYCWKDASDENLRWNRNVINVSSMSGLNAYSGGQAFYSASKAALNMLTLHLSNELSPYSVRANVVCPGRFMDNFTMGPVIESIKALMVNSATGTIVTVLPISPK